MADAIVGVFYCPIPGFGRLKFGNARSRETGVAGSSWVFETQGGVAFRWGAKIFAPFAFRRGFPERPSVIKFSGMFTPPRQIHVAILAIVMLPPQYALLPPRSRMAYFAGIFWRLR